MLPQPPPVFIAMVLLALLSLTNLVPAEQVILEGKPTAAVFLPLVVGVLGLVGAWGLWMLKRWALWLVIIVCVLNILMNAPELTSPSRRSTGRSTSWFALWSSCWWCCRARGVPTPNPLAPANFVEFPFRDCMKSSWRSPDGGSSVAPNTKIEPS